MECIVIGNWLQFIIMASIPASFDHVRIKKNQAMCAAKCKRSPIIMQVATPSNPNGSISERISKATPVRSPDWAIVEKKNSPPPLSGFISGDLSGVTCSFTSDPSCAVGHTATLVTSVGLHRSIRTTGIWTAFRTRNSESRLIQFTIIFSGFTCLKMAGNHPQP